jgi:hypothetical protein
VRNKPAIMAAASTSVFFLPAFFMSNLLFQMKRL